MIGLITSFGLPPCLKRIFGLSYVSLYSYTSSLVIVGFLGYGPGYRIEICSSSNQEFRTQEVPQTTTTNIKWSFTFWIEEVDSVSCGNVIMDVFPYAVSSRCMYRVLMETDIQRRLPGVVGRRLGVHELFQLKSIMQTKDSRLDRHLPTAPPPPEGDSARSEARSADYSQPV